MNNNFVLLDLHQIKAQSNLVIIPKFMRIVSFMSLVKNLSQGIIVQFIRIPMSMVTNHVTSVIMFGLGKIP